MLVAVACALIGPAFSYSLASADITPPEPLPLGGYTARGGKLCALPGEPLAVRCLLFRAGSARIAVVAADLLTIPASLRDEVKKGLPDDVRLFLVATHTHCAPDSQMLNRKMDFALPGIAPFSQKWLEWYATHIRMAVESALEQRAVSADSMLLETSRKPLNRGRRKFALPDTLATRIRSFDGTLLLTSFSAHAVLFGPERNQPSPDFPGKIRDGGLFLPGAIGDMSPASKGSSPEAQIEYFAEQFNGGAWSRTSLNLEPAAFCSVPLKDVEVRPNPEFAKQNRIPVPLADSIVRRFAPTSGELSFIRLGKLAIVGVPGEPTAELGRRIRSIGWGLGFQWVLTVSHCNGWMGYILTPEDYDRGGYEASLAFHGREFGNQIVAAAREGLIRLRNAPKR